MTPELKSLWLTALRSGKYAQAKGKLQTPSGYCCLGVLCKVALDNNMVPEGVSIDTRGLLVVEGPGGYISRRKIPLEPFGLSSPILIEAMTQNDGSDSFAGNPQTFTQIADWLEEVL